MLRLADYFSGFGGFSTGALQLPGVEVVGAVEIHQPAIDVYKANHPGVPVHKMDAMDPDVHKLFAGKVDGLLMAPPCQGHSRGSQPKRRPRHSALRGCAWSVIEAAKTINPMFIIVESVPSFLQWSEYNKWAHALERLGYHVWPHLLQAHDFGVPQLRLRAFIVAIKASSPPWLPKNVWAAAVGRDLGDLARLHPQTTLRDVLSGPSLPRWRPVSASRTRSARYRRMGALERNPVAAGCACWWGIVAASIRWTSRFAR